jgi:hypothetical protein
MESWEISSELERLERLLASGPRPVPSAALRQRVLGDVQGELCGRARLRRWRFAAAFAATVLMALGLSLGVMQASGFALQQDRSPPTLSEIAWRLQQISPGLSREESLRQASLRQIGVEASGATLLSDLLPGT